MALDRISSYGSNAYLVARLLRTQASLQELETQVASEKVSQDYAGISLDAERLINMENDVTIFDRFKVSNETFGVRVETTKTIIGGILKDGETSPSGGIRGALKDFREYLLDFDSGLSTYTADLTDEQLDDLQFRTNNLQKRAYEAMVTVKDYLNEAVGGQFLFAGTRTDTQPVDIETTSQAAFQAAYDGDTVLYPWTRDAHVDTNLTTSTTNTGNLTLDAAADTITAANAGSLSSIPVGSVITLSGSSADDGKFTVISNDGTTITVKGSVNYGAGAATVTANGDITTGETVGATLSVAGYYDGDEESHTHRVDTNQTFEYDINAADPAFEKALRAIGIIAQGAWGTGTAPAAGNLAQHPERIDEALWLVDAALSLNTTGTSPYGSADITTANKNNIEQLEMDIGFYQISLTTSVERHTALSEIYSDRIGNIEDTDSLKAITELLDQQRALEASYEALSRVRQMSLADYI